jgi:hypothetical protein
MKTISKSSFIRGIKCPKALYLHFNEPEERDETSESQQHLFDTGHSVGHLAQQLFPKGIDASRGEPGNYAENIAYTQELINNGRKVIYEAAFGDGETLCYLDILVKKGGKWHAYEVKGSTSVKDYHFMDAAFQYYVINQSGLELADISIVHLNNQYIRRGDLDVQKLFTIVPVTGKIIFLQLDIPVLLMKLQEMLETVEEPSRAIASKTLQLVPEVIFLPTGIRRTWMNSRVSLSTRCTLWISRPSCLLFQCMMKTVRTSRSRFNIHFIFKRKRMEFWSTLNFLPLRRMIHGQHLFNPY